MIRIIKADTNSTKPAQSCDGQAGFVELAHEVDARLKQAHQQAAEIVAQAEDEAQSIRMQAANDGRQDATQTARTRMQEEIEAQLAEALPALDQAVQSIQQAKTEHLRECERHVVRLAVAIAEKLIRAELIRQPEIPLRLVREALDLAAGSQRLTLHLNPLDYQALGTSIDQLTSKLRENVQADIVADPGIARGGCLVRTEFGSIDQQFETQLARIEEELT